MQQPQSLKLKNFLNIHEVDNQVIADDYVYDNNECWKFNMASKNGAKITYEAKLNTVKNFNVKMNDTIKLQFPFHNDKWAWVGIKRDGQLKIHLDGGNLLLPHNIKINPFANVKTTTEFSKYALRFGFNWFGEKNNLSMRFNFGGCCDPNCVAASLKYLYKSGPFFAGASGIFRLPAHNPCQYEQMVGYLQDNYKFYMQYVSPSCDQKICSSPKNTLQKFLLAPGKLIATAVFKKNKQTLGGQLCYDIANKKPCMKLALENKCSDKTTGKIMLNCCFDLSLAYKHKFSDFFTLKFGMMVPLKQFCKMSCCKTGASCCGSESKCCKSEDKCCPLAGIKHGVQFELNL